MYFINIFKNEVTKYFSVNYIIMELVFQEATRLKKEHYTCRKVNFWSLIL